MAQLLVIDDCETLNEMVVQLLTKAGHRAFGVLDGREGLYLLRNIEFDLVITDLIMPEKEGLETIIAIRKINKSIPIIAMSGGGKDDPGNNLQMAQYLGANYTFQKPFNRKLFLSAIKKCLDGSLASGVLREMPLDQSCACNGRI